jgi:hypothetical protein
MSVASSSSLTVGAPARQASHFSSVNPDMGYFLF